MKTLITDRTLRGLKPAPAGKRTVVWDTVVPGLCVRVTDKGAASFNVMRRLKGHSGSPLRRALGISWHVPFPAGQPLPHPLAEAREDARAMILDMARGIDPKAREKERQEEQKRKEVAKRLEEARKQTHTFAAVVEVFIAKHVNSLRSARDVEATIRRELIPVLGEKQLATITQDDIVALIDDVVESGRPYVAKHMLAYLSKFFAWVIAKRRYGITVSPCSGVKAKDIVGELKARQRVLSDTELAALWTATAGLDYPSAPFVRLLILTGQRLREVAEMRWSEVDLDKRLWMVPGERMKADATHIVPLSPAVVEILKSLPHWAGDYVFSTTGGQRPISGFSKMKLRIDGLMPGVSEWRFHDLRRTMRTGLSALRVPNVVAELCIGHTQKDLHKVYDQHAYLDEKRAAFEAWANRIMSIVEPGEAGNILQLKARS